MKSWEFAATSLSPTKQSNLGCMDLGIPIARCEVGHLPGTRVAIAAIGAPGQNCQRFSFRSNKFTMFSTFVGLCSEPRYSSKSGAIGSTPVRCRIRSGQKGRGHSWKASGGIQVPDPVSFWEGVTNPIVRTIQNQGLFTKKQESESEPEPMANKEAEAETRVHFQEERTIDSTFQKGELSVAALDCIEKFSRLNGLSGKKMRCNFESSAPPSIQTDARSLVEFACFRYLSRCTADIHPSLKDAAFRRLTFSAMLAWQRPYKKDLPENGSAGSNGLPGIGRVGEEAFVRMAPAIAGAADRPTAHGLFRALAGESGSLSFDVWDRYCSELCKVVKLQEQQQEHEGANLPLEEGEFIVRIEADSRQPVQKWNGTAWPGRLTLTNRSLYFEANGLGRYKKATRLDLTGPEASVEKKLVGPFGIEIFNSAISVSPSRESEPWVVEFVDFKGLGRRDIWLAFIKEIFAANAFICEYGVRWDDELTNYIHGAKHGRKKALSSPALGIARLLALQAIVKKLPPHPERLLQFSYLANAPSGEVVSQALAVAFWGGRMEGKSKEIELAMGGGDLPLEEGVPSRGSNLVGTDGTVYLRKWATSRSWRTGGSEAFWKASSTYKGMVLGRNHVVGGLTQVERAVKICQDQANIAEQTQATIDAALLKGIPPNLDLLKELFLPFYIAADVFGKLKKWENPGASTAFLFVAFGVIYMDWVKHVVPSLVFFGAGSLLALRIMKSRGNIGSDFGKVTIREQPPTNTIQQIMALRDALSNLEDFLQDCNIALLKLRTVSLSREPRVTNEVLLALAGLGATMLIVPFRYLVGFFILDQFTNELKFREKSAQRIWKSLRSWWNTIPASPVVVLPRKKEDAEPALEDLPTKGEALVQAVSEWLGEDGEVFQLSGES